MSQAKVIAVVVIVAIVIAALSIGGSFLVASSRQKKEEKEFQTAKGLLENKQTEEALRLLKEHITKYPKGATAAESMFLLAKTQIEQKADSTDALALCERILKDFPNSPFAAQALYYKALSIVKERPIKDENKPVLTEMAKKSTSRQASYVAEYGLALVDLDEGRFPEAKSKMDALLERSIPDVLRQMVEDSLGSLNLRMLNSQELYGDDQTHELQTGDYLYKLAKKYDISLELLMKVNSITDPKRLPLGQKLKIPKLNFSILVDKNTNTLTLLNDGKFFKKYIIRTGAYENQTPLGEYKIQNKKHDPKWVNPRTLKIYNAGDPENELGTRWMSFKDDRLGIHGTIKPETIGYYSSFGCVGMLKEDVEELFDLITVGTPIKIVGQMNPEIVEKSKALGYRD